jgi:RNA-binding protein
MPALSLSAEQRAELRSAAHALKPVVLVGAEGLTDAVFKEIGVHLAAHQLIKIRVFGDERDARIAIYDEICDRLNAAPIQHIGKLLVIWKPAEPAPKTTTARAGARGTVKRPAADVRGNERVTQGGNVKRAKKRQTSAKRPHQGTK